MCTECGCGLPGQHHHHHHHEDHHAANHEEKRTLEVLQNLLNQNDLQARHNREHFQEHHVLAVNLMSSPGSGKTSLIESTIDQLSSRLRIAVIEGDLETENDAQRIRAKGVPAVQITTGSACHLDAQMVHHGLHDLNLDEVDILFIENVGNLVCPASYDLGQHFNVVLLSSTEGDDKPAKYPVMFRAADLMLVTKSDLLPVLGDFNPQKAEQHFRRLAKSSPVIQLSSRNREGMDLWLSWLEQQWSKVIY